MIGYILMGLGAYLLYDDYKQAKDKKSANSGEYRNPGTPGKADKLLEKGGADENVLENGSRGTDSDSGRESSSASQAADRKRGVSPIGIPAKTPTTNTAGKKGVNENELSQKPIQQVKLDTPGNSLRDDSGSQSDAASLDSKAKGVKDENGGQENAGNENNLENGAGNDGNDVDS